MSELDDQLVAGIKRAMKARGVSMRGLSSRVGMPYRSLQNYLSGATRMPASVYVQLCEALGVDNQYVLKGHFHLPHWELRDVLWKIFGDALPDLPKATNTNERDNVELNHRKHRAAADLAIQLSEEFNAMMLRDLGESVLPPLSTPDYIELERKRNEQLGRGPQLGPQSE